MYVLLILRRFVVKVWIVGHNVMEKSFRFFSGRELTSLDGFPVSCPLRGMGELTKTHGRAPVEIDPFI